MIIALPPGHACAGHLFDLARSVRELRREQCNPATRCLGPAINMTETRHGSRAATFRILPGHAGSDDAVAAYRYLRSRHRPILTLLSMVARARASEITVEVGTLARRDILQPSDHEMMAAMPRVLALFRGTV